MKSESSRRYSERDPVPAARGAWPGRGPCGSAVPCRGMRVCIEPRAGGHDWAFSGVQGRLWRGRLEPVEGNWKPVVQVSDQAEA